MLLVGDGPNWQSLVARVGEACRDGAAIDLKERCDRGSVLKMIGVSHLGLLASAHEGFGLFAAECSGLGLPVLAFDVSGGVQFVV